MVDNSSDHVDALGQPPPNRRLIHGYMKSLRGCDKAVKNLFEDIVIIKPDETVESVPLIWGSQEKALIAAFGNNIRRDGSGEIDRVTLPLMGIVALDPTFSAERYTYHKAVDWFRYAETGGLFGQEKVQKDVRFAKMRGIPIDRMYTLRVWTKYWEDMHQIIEQIFLKFSPIAYIQVEGIDWETIVKLESVANNVDMDVGDASVRIMKYEVGVTAETYIHQPIVRNKTVLQIRNKFQVPGKEEELIEKLE